MRHQTFNSNDHEKQKAVLTRALLSMAQAYQLSRKDLCDIVGFSEASASRLCSGKKPIDPETKEGEIALLLLRLYRSLNTILGDNDVQANIWLRSYHHYFGATPLEHIRHLTGLIEVVNYLDGMRGKI